MDCPEALERLELPDELGGPPLESASPAELSEELNAARLHVASCPSCARITEQRGQLDRRIGMVMRDVPVPASLRERLLSALAQTGDAAHRVEVHAVARKAESTQLQRRTDRRFWLQLTVGLCAALCVAAFFWNQSKPPKAEHLALRDIRDRVPVVLDNLDPFQGNFEPELPPDGWNSGGIRFEETVVGFHRDSRGRHLAAVREFSFRNREGELLRGVLVIIPRSVLDDAPAAQFFSASGSTEYLRRDERTFATVAWSQNEFAYVCFVPAENDALESLERALSSPPV